MKYVAGAAWDTKFVIFNAKVKSSVSVCGSTPKKVRRTKQALFWLKRNARKKKKTSYQCSQHVRIAKVALHI